MTEAAIVKATGLPRPQDAASLTVARSEVAVQAAERWEFLTLDQAAALAEDGVEALTASGPPHAPEGSVVLLGARRAGGGV